MKNVCVLSLLLLNILSGCKKQVVEPNESSKLYDDGFYQQQRLIRPILPDTLHEPGIPIWPRLPRIPRSELFFPVAISRCIISYEELVTILGTNKINFKAVVLDGGVAGEITLSRSDNLPAIWYTAVRDVSSSSLFTSQLQVEWRPDASVYFTGFTAEVWSAGCVYEQTVVGPFTNILKGGVEVLINTIFFWGVGEYAGYRIKYLVTD